MWKVLKIELRISEFILFFFNFITNGCRYRHTVVQERQYGLMRFRIRTKDHVWLIFWVKRSSYQVDWSALSCALPIVSVSQLTVNVKVKVVTVLSLTSDTVESEECHRKQCWKKRILNKYFVLDSKKHVPRSQGLYRYVSTLKLPDWPRLTFQLLAETKPLDEIRSNVPLPLEPPARLSSLQYTAKSNPYPFMAWYLLRFFINCMAPSGSHPESFRTIRFIGSQKNPDLLNWTGKAYCYGYGTETFKFNFLKVCITVSPFIKRFFF